jgi:hypothetical protein
MPPRRRLASADPEPTRTSPNLRESVAASIAAMTHLQLPEDQALVDLALSLADQIELAHERTALAERIMTEAAGDPGIFRRLQKLEAMCDATKTVGWLGPQLQGVLRDLAGQPSARKTMSPASPAGSRLADLRQAAAAKPRRPR